ncbi:MAG: Tetrahedral aminopeptidase [Candidatus Methanolliviera sp. GoM_oil]|nr:MAG: Tetrahedral aminopeptidase [Candidatus Methanolliviera sp. GoM_oil]
MIEQRSLDFLKQLMNTTSPSGFEGEASHLWCDEARRFTDNVKVDLHGNSIAIVNQGGSPRVMIAGHLDEIGLMVNYIDDDGFIYFSGIGGWDPQILAGQRVWIQSKEGKIKGGIGKKPIHMLTKEERKKAVEIKDLWIDIGAKDKKDAERLISIGDPIVLAYDLCEMENGLILSKGCDDKTGAFVALEAARMLSTLKPKAEIYAVATVQEEVGLRGATTSAFGVDPKVGIAVDVGFATDFPTMKEEKKRVGDARIGSGPIIARGANINHKIYDLLVETAKEHKISYQISGAPRGTGTDANPIQLTRSGVAASLVSIPNRYMHTPCEVVSLKDIEETYKLIAYAIEKINDEMDLTPF